LSSFEQAVRGAWTLAVPLLLAAVLAGCGSPKVPPQEILGSTGLVFPARPGARLQDLDLVWDALVRNGDNTTSAAAQLHLAIKSSRTGLTTERTAAIERLAPHTDARLQVRTPYDGVGDYSGVAEILVGDLVVQRAFVFYEQCAPMAAC
jgi:hypothetical protein